MRLPMICSRVQQFLKSTVSFVAFASQAIVCGAGRASPRLSLNRGLNERRGIRDEIDDDEIPHIPALMWATCSRGCWGEMVAINGTMQRIKAIFHPIVAE
jgi:hypothetical protein